MAGRDVRRRSRSNKGSVALRGTCPVCRRGNVRLRTVDGKLGFHGKSAASPRGCDGSGQPPLRTGADGVEREQTGATVIGFKAADTDPGQPPGQPPRVFSAVQDDGPDVPVVPGRAPDLDLRLRNSPSMPDLPPTG